MDKDLIYEPYTVRPLKFSVIPFSLVMTFAADGLYGQAVRPCADVPNLWVCASSSPFIVPWTPLSVFGISMRDQAKLSHQNVSTH